MARARIDHSIHGLPILIHWKVRCYYSGSPFPLTICVEIEYQSMIYQCIYVSYYTTFVLNEHCRSDDITYQMKADEDWLR